ncbi:MAG: FtsX-like permease family protein [Bacteroidetes bacterium]|nr:MAG: FtsX-like permease family protein [Bacteroidota bacterium]
MIKNIPFILRRFKRQRLTTFLHVLGLTLGISVCLLIGLFIKHELSFDSYESKADRTYRINQVWIDFGKKNFHFSTPFPLADQVRKDVPGLEYVTKVHHPFESIIEITPLKRFKQDNVMMTDPEFIDVFDVKVIEGNAYEALRKPYQAVLTETTAKKFFGNEDPIGKTFTYNNKFPITVGALIKDFPGNTHLPASMLLSFADNEDFLHTSTTHYGSVSGGSTFIVLPKGSKPGTGLTSAIQSIYDRFANNQKWAGKEHREEAELQPLRDIHFNSKYAGGGQWVKAINTTWLWFFGAIGLAVLILACINFVNLSTAQALSRAKEIGIRKSIGAGRVQLITQFLSEALLLVLFSAIVAGFIVKISLPSINQLSGKQMAFNPLESPTLIISLLLGIFATAFLAGIYPAWIITRFQPATTLKTGSVNASPQSSLLRKGLVITQFTISVCLLIGLLLIGKQMDFMQHKDLGFDKDNIVTVPVEFSEKSQQKLLMGNELSNIPGIKEWSFSTSPPSGEDEIHWGTVMSITGKDDPNQKSVTTIMSDEKFCSLYNLKLKAGRFFTISDTSAVSNSVPAGQRYAKSVVNEKLVQELGFPSLEAALGKRFWIGMNGWTAEIVGVVADFNIGSLRETIKPTLVTQFLPFADKLNIKLAAGSDIPTTINRINAAYKKAYPTGVFEFNFLDQRLDALYKDEARLYGLFKIFSGLAMLISCLGLWGLITFAAQKRIKEIGVRKVLGASVPNIVSLLAKDFLILVFISIAIAAPLAYWGIHRWLQDFAFRINIGWTAFVIAGIVALLIALATVSFQAIKAAIANPVKSLRTE